MRNMNSLLLENAFVQKHNAVQEIHCSSEKLLQDYAVALKQFEASDSELEELKKELKSVTEEAIKVEYAVTDAIMDSIKKRNAKEHLQREKYQKYEEAIREWKSRWFFKGPKPEKVENPAFSTNYSSMGYFNNLRMHLEIHIPTAKNPEKEIQDMIKVASKSEFVVFNQAQYNEYVRVTTQDNVKVYKEDLTKQIEFIKKQIAMVQAELNNIKE